MKHKMLKRIAALALSFTLTLAVFAPVVVSANDATWQEVLDTGLFIAIRGHNTGNPVLSATADGLVLSNRGAIGTAYGEHDGIGIDLMGLRRLSETGSSEVVISGTIEGTADRMFAQFFDGFPNRGADDWIRSYIGAGGSFEMDLTEALPGVPAWGGDWGIRSWLGAHPRGNITISSITVGGESILSLLGDGAEVETVRLDLGMPTGVNYSLLHDNFIQNLAVGSSVNFGVTPHFAGAELNITAVENPLGGIALRFTNRSNEWDGFNLLWRELGMPEGDYYIMVAGSIELASSGDAAGFVIAGSGAPYSWVGPEEFPEDTGLFIMERPFSVIGNEVHHEENGVLGGHSIRMRPMSDERNNNFIIYQMAIVPAGSAFPLTPGMDALLQEPEPQLPEVPETPPPHQEVPETPEQPPVTGLSAAISLNVGSTTATVNGVSQTLDAAPFIADGRTMVPFRFIGEELGATVDWTPDAEGRVRDVHFVDGAVSIDVRIGEALYGGGHYLGTPVVVDGRTFVPLRFVSQAMGATFNPDPPLLPNISIFGR